MTAHPELMEQLPLYATEFLRGLLCSNRDRNTHGHQLEEHVVVSVSSSRILLLLVTGLFAEHMGRRSQFNGYSLLQNPLEEPGSIQCV